MSTRWLPTGRGAKWIETGGGLALIVIVMLWQAGTFACGRIRPGGTALAGGPAGGPTVAVEAADVPAFYRAVGTVRSRTQIDLSPRIVARIREIPVRSGDRVSKGDALLKLDDTDLAAGVRQAAEGVRRAQAAFDLAATELERSRKLLSTGTTTQQAFDQADAAHRQAAAALQGAEETRVQAEATLGYAMVASPIDGVVAERLADPGDLASPGNIVLRLFDPTRLMLDVPVREGLVSRIRIGEQVAFRVEALATNLTGDVREIVPSVDPGSRTFLVKICIGEAPALMPGMFGVLELPTGTRRALVVPDASVTRVGQLEYVQAMVGDRLRQVLVRTVPAGSGRREVVSGLEAGMRIAVGEK